MVSGREVAGTGVSGTAASRVATVEVHADPLAVAAEWRRLAASWPSTPYQAPEWLVPWVETVGIAMAIRPMIVVARDAAGAPIALLPFGIQRKGLLAVAAFLGAKDSNYNMGLFRRGERWTDASLSDLLRRAALASRQRVDLFALRNQPTAWGDVANPFALLPGQPSPSFAYKASLTKDADAFFARHLSRDNRKKLRQKAARLQALGAWCAFRAETAEEIAEVLDAMLEQRRARCEALGLPTDDLAELRRFLVRATAPGPAQAIELHALRCRDRIVATLAGATRAGRFSGMLTSFAAESEAARASPGELLLADVMRRACRDGVSVFDLGIGEARYKETYCPEVDPLFDSLVPITVAGYLAAAAESLRLKAKRIIKQSPRAWRLARRLRRHLASLRVAPPA